MYSRTGTVAVGILHGKASERCPEGRALPAPGDCPRATALALCYRSLVASRRMTPAAPEAARPPMQPAHSGVLAIAFHLAGSSARRRCLARRQGT